MWEAVEDKRPGWGSSACWLHFRLGLRSHGVMLLKLRGPNIFLLKFSIKNKSSSTEEEEVQRSMVLCPGLYRLPGCPALGTRASLRAMTYFWSISRVFSFPSVIFFFFLFFFGCLVSAILPNEDRDLSHPHLPLLELSFKPQTN